MDASTLCAATAAEALRRNAIPVLRRLAVEESADVVILSGQVGSYYHKQLAQETVLPYLHGRELINRVAVQRREPAK
jgi:hypothetical protein